MQKASTSFRGFRIEQLIDMDGQNAVSTLQLLADLGDRP